MSAGRNVPDRGLQTGQGLRQGRVMLAVKGQQFVENVMALLQGRMMEHLSAGHHLIGDATETLGDFDMGMSRVFTGRPPTHGQGVEVVIAQNQVVGDAEDGGAEPAIGAAAQGAVAEIDLVALVTGGTQTGAAGDATRVSVVGDGSHLAGEVRGGDDVDAGKGQQQDIGSLGQVAGDIAFPLENFLGFAGPIVVERQGDAAVQGSRLIARGRLAGPGQHALHGRSLETHFLAPQQLQELRQSRRVHGRRRLEVPQQRPSQGTVPELVEATGEAGQGCFEMFPDLRRQGRGLEDQIAAMADQQLQFAPDGFDRPFEQGEAVDGGAVDGRQIGIVGFVAGIADLAVALGGEGVDDADLVAGGGQSLADDVVVTAGAFDGDNQVVQRMKLLGLTQAGDGGFQVSAVMFDDGGRNQDVAKEVAQHPFGAGLGAIDTDDAEMLRADFLDPDMNDPRGFLLEMPGPPPRTLTYTSYGHDGLPPRKLGNSNSLAKQSGSDYFLAKPTYQGSSWQSSVST